MWRGPHRLPRDHHHQLASAAVRDVPVPELEAPEAAFVKQVTGVVFEDETWLVRSIRTHQP
jgi:hypothetical protein